MKRFLLTILTAFFLLPGFTSAQVRVLSETVEFSGRIGTAQRKSLIVQNESSQVKEYSLKFLRGNIGSSQNIKLCISDKCFDPRREMAKIKLTLQPGEILTDLYIEFDMGISETKGNFDLQFVNASNPRDIFVIESIYEVFNPTVDHTNHKDITIGSAYPNPSSRSAQIDYEYKNPKASAKITINSFIGNPVAEYTLDPVQNSIVINVTDLNPGVYFYTLYVDNKNIVTKKLVVKK